LRSCGNPSQPGGSRFSPTFDQKMPSDRTFLACDSESAVWLRSMPQDTCVARQRKRHGQGDSEDASAPLGYPAYTASVMDKHQCDFRQLKNEVKSLMGSAGAREPHYRV
jgi:hypothetical protein